MKNKLRLAKENWPSVLFGALVRKVREFQQLVYLRANKFTSTPSLFPIYIDNRFDKLSVSFKTQDEYENYALHNFVRFAPNKGTYRIALTSNIKNKILERDNPVNLIFHHAFCGSTLLARYLDETGQFMSHREPNILANEVLRFINRPKHRDTALAIQRLSFTLSLFSRRFSTHSQCVVKTRCIENTVIQTLLENNNKGKAILLFSPLEEFLAHLLTREPKESVELLLSWITQDKNDLVHLNLASPIEVGTYWWLTQVNLFEQAIFSNRERVFSLNSVDLYTRPEDVLERISIIFGAESNKNNIHKAIEYYRYRYSKIRKEKQKNSNQYTPKEWTLSRSHLVEKEFAVKKISEKWPMLTDLPNNIMTPK